jgi:hypothetical protein
MNQAAAPPFDPDRWRLRQKKATRLRVAFFFERMVRGETSARRTWNCRGKYCPSAWALAVAVPAAMIVATVIANLVLDDSFWCAASDRA